MGSRRCRPGCRWRDCPSRPDGGSTRSAAQHPNTATHAAHADTTAAVDTTTVDAAAGNVAAIDAAIAASATLTFALVVTLTVAATVALTVAATASSDRLPVLPARMA